MDHELPTFNAMYQHSVWANNRLLDQAALLTEADLNEPVAGADGSILQILVHNFNGQFGWLRRFQALQPMPPPGEGITDIATLRQAWERLDTETVAYIQSLTPDDLNEVLVYGSWSGWQGTGPRWQILLHQAFHQHQHRGEVALALTRLGYSPGEIDILDHMEEQGTVLFVTP